MKQFSDDQLMELIINGQNNYLAEIYARYKNELFGFFYHLNHQSAISEDLVQNVFVRIIKYNKSYKSSGRFRSWLYQLARNAQADLFKTNQHRFQAQFENLKDEQYEIKTEQSDDQQLDMLNQALHQLDSEKRELLILSRFQKLSYAEIAELLNTSEGAIKVRMYRVMCELRELVLQIEREQA